MPAQNVPISQLPALSPDSSLQTDFGPVVHNGRYYKQTRSAADSAQSQQNTGTNGFWRLKGNASTSTATNFVGTIDSIGLYVGSNFNISHNNFAYSHYQICKNGTAGEADIVVIDTINNVETGIVNRLAQTEITEQNITGDTFAIYHFRRDSVTFNFQRGSSLGNYTFPITEPSTGQILTALSNNGTLRW